MRKTNQAGVDLIKSFEGFRANAYKLDGENHYTIGYGHSFDSAINAHTVWTQAQAETALKKDLAKFEGYVEQYAKQYGFTLNDNQFAALVSYCYNRGPGGLKELLSHSKTIAEISANIVIYWGSATRYKTGLVNRREKEKALFDKPMDKPKEQPKPKPTAKPKEQPKPVKHPPIYYTIKPGDKLAAIAKKFGTTSAAIDKLNASITNINKINAGQKIRVK